MVSVAIVLGSIGSLSLATAVLFLFPRRVQVAASQLRIHPFRALLLGGMGLVMAFPIFVFLALTLIGIPLAFVSAAAFAAALILGTVGAGAVVGEAILQKFRRKLPFAIVGLIGLLALTVMAALPLVGILLQGLLACAALGSVILSRFAAAD